mmetsp:Transcript_72256/g.200423  ORF Transcript_72256/g.200423 Transcript_72256/m.200423 type:complete len:738 (+) Transcript_72256:61-2274(+)
MPGGADDAEAAADAQGTLRSRDAAIRMVEKFTASFAGDESKVIPTVQLVQRLRRGEDVVLVDVRTKEEQTVSMIPGALTREAFEAELLPSLAQQAATGSDTRLVVPYCTVGYRSGMYCRDLRNNHGLRKVQNGEGVLMWTFDGGPLVRPSPDAVVSRAPQIFNVKAAPVSEIAAAGDEANEDEVQSQVIGRGIESSPSDDVDANSAANISKEVHVFGKPWDCAAPGYKTVYFPPVTGAYKSLMALRLGGAVRKVSLWFWTFLVFYIFFTPACGVMYDCGCRLAFSKWAQVETCNAFANDKGREAHQCPWCSCSGFACIFVAFDTRAFRGVFVLDTLPDGFFLTVVTVVVLSSLWNCFDKLDRRRKMSEPLVFIVKASIVLLWFLAYCLCFGALFFAFDSDYPYFLGVRRSEQVDDVPLATLIGVEGRYMIRPQELKVNLENYDVLDARANYEVSFGVIPGAIVAPWVALAEGGAPRDGRKSILRSPAEVVADFRAVGVNGTRPIAVYGDWDKGWGEEGRLFWTLEYFGIGDHDKGIFCLEGGTQAWRSAGLSMEPPALMVARATGSSAVAVSVNTHVRATTDFLATRDGENLVILDVRTVEEFDGQPSGDVYGAARSGHIPNAIWWSWRENLFMPTGPSQGSPELQPCEAIQRSLPPAAANAEVVAYCTAGVRSGFVYMVLRGCGFPKVRNYDGSWWAWASDAALPCSGVGPGCVAPEPEDVDGSAGSAGGSGGSSW